MNVLFRLGCQSVIVGVWLSMGCGFTSFVQAATLVVPTQHFTIQGALNAAQDGDTVLVRPGEYSGVKLSFEGKAIRLKSESGPAVTTIRGDSVNPVFSLFKGETRATIIEGFTITGGGGGGGGAMRLNRVSPTVRRNIITGNRATSLNKGTGGGGIEIVNSPANPLIFDNTFENNEAGRSGGAIYLHGNATAVIRHNTFVGNRATQDGGGAISLANRSGAAVAVRDNYFANNFAASAGGAISIFNANAIVTGNTIVNNDAGTFGGGLKFETQDGSASRSLIASNNRIEGNTTTNKGGGIVTFTPNTGSFMKITNNVIIGNRCIAPASTSSGPYGDGGGIGSYHGTGAMEVSGNLIRDNVADRYGAAIFSTMPLMFTANQVINNRARWQQPGVGAETTSSTQITRNVFRGNRFLTGGKAAIPSPGGLLVRFFVGDALVEGNFFVGNWGTKVGALMIHASNGSKARIVGNSFVGNQLLESTPPQEGAVWLLDDGDICDNTFTNNDGYGIFLKGNPPSTVGVNNNHFFGNSSGVLFRSMNYTTVSALNGTTFAANNIDGNPLFVNDGSFRLSSASPLVGKANLACFVVAKDVQGEPRLQPADIGGDELSDKDPFTVGLFRSDLSKFYLRNGNNAGATDISFGYGAPGSNLIPLAGDWDGDGKVSVGVFDPVTSIFSLRNSNTAGTADIVFKFGLANSGWVPLAGDWDGNKVTTVGFYRPAKGQFLLRNSNAVGTTDIAFLFGPANSNWLPIIGDWDGDGRQTIGLYRPDTNTVYLRNSNAAGGPDVTFRFFGQANAGWLPIAGDWNGDQIFSLGLYRPSTSTFYLRNSNTTGGAEIAFNYGPAGAGWMPLAGQWDGL